MTSPKNSLLLVPPGTLSLGEATQLMRGQVYPVFLSYQCDYTPLHGVGTAFLLEHKGHLFAISAQHVLDSQHASGDDFRLLIKDTMTPMIFDGAALFQPEYEPHFDLLIRRISPLQLGAIRESGACWLDTSAGIREDGFPHADLFLVFGYPEDGREYDYEKKSVSAYIDVLIGQHTEPQVPGLGTLKITGGRETSYRGLSGSLVIADIDGLWRFAGMVTMGSETSKLVNFIPASAIAYYLERVTEILTHQD